MSGFQIRKYTFVFRVLSELFKRRDHTYDSTVFFEAGREISGPYTHYYLFFFHLAFMFTVFSAKKHDEIVKIRNEFINDVLRNSRETEKPRTNPLKLVKKEEP